MTALTEATTIDEVAGRLFESVIATADLFTMYLGDRLGLYRELARRPRTSSELAESTGVMSRYAQEWCEAQAACGWIECENADATASERVFSLPPALAEAMLDENSLAHLAPAIRMMAAVGSALPALVETYRGERTTTWADYGPIMREAQAAANRPIYRALLANDWLARVPDVHQRIAAPRARVAEVGCGMGWAGICLAQAFPDLTVDGYDIDGPSIEEARGNADSAGVADRVSFHLVDAGTVGEAPSGYDLVIACECVHDLSRPVDVLRTMRAMAAPTGEVLVLDERTEEAFTPDAPPMERLLYGFSVLVCLPDGMSDQPSAGTGTVMRASTLADYAREAGFVSSELIDLHHEQFRMYRLRS